MKQLLSFLLGFLGCELALGAEAMPTWAYAQNPPNTMAIPADDSIRKVPNSNMTYTFAQVKDLFFAPDWHPEDHAPLPEVVEYGRKPHVYACGFCHRADGSGGPENASLAGLPKDYIIQQMADFKSGARTSAIANRAPVTNMKVVANAVSNSDIDAAANYFSSLTPRKNITVIETHSVPHTFERGWHLAKSDGTQTELLGRRIIEVPESLDNFISRDSHARFIAYVPKGSILAGKKISQSSNKITACAQCHGKSLRGQDNIPALAGRSPSYLVRQLYDFKLGFRSGPTAQPMHQVVKDLDANDIIAVAAYAANLRP
jgi:cytochrome c553